MADVEIRDALPLDELRLSEIYTHYVERTAITFDFVPRTAEGFAELVASVQESYPFLVAVLNGDVVGYAYAARFRRQAAYDACVELSIYLDPSHMGEGIGRMLYEELERRLVSQGVTNLYACVAYPIEPDEYLDANSAEFHEHLGFTTIGRFHRCGRKFGRVYDMIWMEKLLDQQQF